MDKSDTFRNIIYPALVIFSSVSALLVPTGDKEYTALAASEIGVRCKFLKSNYCLLAVITALIIATAMLAHPAWADEIDCLQCHKDLTEGKVVHPAVQIGCGSCHTGVDASVIPHKFKGKLGLSAKPPALCFQCHDKSAFTKKIIHAPVEAGMCLSCHTPHSGPYDSLLKVKGNALCLECHPQLPQSHPDHPLWGEHDPVRKGKPFGCISCHVPHSSDWGKLFRYKATDFSGLCAYCHHF